VSVTADSVARAGGVSVSRLMERVEARMGVLARENGPVLARYAGSTIAAGGKRVRPLLVCLAAGVPSPERRGVVRAAVAVELIHSATLVHDDVLDAAELRRGRATVFALAGRDAATAAGDLLLSRAFAELAAPGLCRQADAAERERARASVRMLAHASTELAAGELMQRADAYDTRVGRQRYLERCRLKTGVLFRAACELGAFEGDSPLASLSRFGERIGIAFQILDDVLDVTGPPERTGKPRGADLLDGTVTLPLILARERDERLRRLDLRQVRTRGAAAEACELIASSGALQEARTAALSLVASAKDLLAELPVRQRQALELVADGVVERYS
jgi:geranylgeranyl pyrophosphate synthase